MHIELTGSGIEQAAARADLVTHSLLAALGVFLLIQLGLVRLRNVLLVAINLPFALVGGVAAVIVTGASLSLGSIVGFVTLFGITVRNSIMLVSHYRQLVTVDGEPWNIETAVRGARERFPLDHDDVARDGARDAADRRRQRQRRGARSWVRWRRS